MGRARGLRQDQHQQHDGVRSPFGFSNFVCATVEQWWIMLYAACIGIWGVTSPTAVHETTKHNEIEGIPISKSRDEQHACMS